jgi:hypothetical protein
MERLLIKKIKGGFLGLKTGTKEPIEVYNLIKKLKEINPMLGEDYEATYIKIVKNLSK